VHVDTWLESHGGISPRARLRAAGFTDYAIRASAARRLGAGWLALPSAPGALVRAASSGARLACVSVAEHRGLALLHRPEQPHLHLSRQSSRMVIGARVHRSRPIVATGPGELVESVPDMLEHVAECLPRLEALIVWESAAQQRLITPATARRIEWPRRAARELAAAMSADSESILESIAFHRLLDAGIMARQQVPLLGHDVDLLIGDHLVVQLDGHEFHSSRADRARDLQHDARLMLEGFTVLRFDYDAVVHDWPRVLATIRLAVAQRRHG